MAAAEDWRDEGEVVPAFPEVATTVDSRDEGDVAPAFPEEVEFVKRCDTLGNDEAGGILAVMFEVGAVELPSHASEPGRSCTFVPPVDPSLVSWILPHVPKSMD